MFNPDLLAQLIKRAQGNRSLNQFARLSGIDSGNLSRILNNKNQMPPKPSTLKKIADNAFEAVSYEQLMLAAGHISFGEAELQLPAHNEPLKSEQNIEKKIEAFKKELLNNREELLLAGEPVSREAVESIIEALSFGLKQAKLINKGYNSKK